MSQDGCGMVSLGTTHQYLLDPYSLHAVGSREDACPLRTQTKQMERKEGVGKSKRDNRVTRIQGCPSEKQCPR